MKIFKKKRQERLKQPLGFGKELWGKIVGYYKKDVDENVDPEKEAQAIYLHWIKSYLRK